jgi:hypothetical protein
MAIADWSIEYIVVRRVPGGEFETVAFSNPGQGCKTVGEANEVLKMLQRADIALGEQRVASFTVQPVAIHKGFGTFELELPNGDTEDDH